MSNTSDFKKLDLKAMFANMPKAAKPAPKVKKFNMPAPARIKKIKEPDQGKCVAKVISIQPFHCTCGHVHNVVHALLGKFEGPHGTVSKVVPDNFPFPNDETETQMRAPQFVSLCSNCLPK